MDQEYIDFKVTLIWHKAATNADSNPGKISAEYECSECSPPWQASSTPIDIPESISNPALLPGEIKPPEEKEKSDIIKEGKDIANLLLPDVNGIRVTFRELWRSGEKIRLRLTYPHPKFDDEGNIDDRNEQMEQIMKIIWENICLSKGDEEEGLEHFLCIRPEISIVHCLRKPQMGNTRSVNQLPIKMTYISRLNSEGPDSLKKFETDDQRIFKEFKQRVQDLDGLFTIPTLDADPNSFDVTRAFQKDHFVHLTVHGSFDAIKVDPDDVLTREELLIPFKITDKPELIAVILLSCNSASKKAGRGLNISAVLHRHAEIPIVIGTTGAIPIPSSERFVIGFYEEIGRNPNISLETAVVSGRFSILNEAVNPEGEEKWDTSFSLPRLFLNGPDSVLVPEALLFGSLETMVSGVSGFDNIINDDGGLANRNPEINENLQTLINWIVKEKNAWYLVTGPERSDTRTLMACLVHQLTKEKEETPQSPPIIYHFCQIEDAKTSDPLDFIRHSLAPQLVKHYGEDYKKAIPEGSFPLRVGNEKEAMRAFVIEPLPKLKGKIKPVIIIDGIDVVDPNYSILDLLVDNRGDLEDIARFIVTANTVEVGSAGSEDIRNAQKIMDNIHWLTNHHHDGQSDLPIKVSNDPRILFSKMKERFPPLLSETSPIREWGELNNLFDQAIETAQRKHEEFDWWKEKVTRLLEVVTVACEPLPADSVAVIIGLEASGDEMKQLQSVLQSFFKNYENYENSFKLFHSSLKTHLLNRIGRQPQQSLANVHDLFVQAFRPQSGDWTEITDWESLTGTKWEGMFTDKTKGHASISHYVRRYLSYHAYYSYYYTPSTDPLKRRERAKDFLNLTCDPGYRAVRLVEVGREEAVQDLWKGLRVVYTEYLHNLSPQENNVQARLALDRLLAANEPGSSGRNELIKLEQRLRNDPKAGWKDLFEFLGLDIGWWEA